MSSAAALDFGGVRIRSFQQDRTMHAPYYPVERNCKSFFCRLHMLSYNRWWDVSDLMYFCF